MTSSIEKNHIKPSKEPGAVPGSEYPKVALLCEKLEIKFLLIVHLLIALIYPVIKPDSTLIDTKFQISD
jgi:hypothetical protein